MLKFDMVYKDKTKFSILDPNLIIPLRKKNKRNIIWIDDDNTIIKDYRVNHYNCSSLIAKKFLTIQHGINYFKSKMINTDAIFLDLKFNSEYQGINAIQEIRKLNKDFPVFIVSGYLHHNDLMRDLDQFSPTGRLNKPIPSQFLPNFKSMSKAIIASMIFNENESRWLSLDNPLPNLKHSELKSLSLKTVKEKKLEIWRNYEKTIRHILTETKKEWCIIIKDEVIVSSKKELYPTPEILRNIASTTGYVPFVYTKVPLIEESAWYEIPDSHHSESDFYPTLSLTIDLGKNKFNDDYFFDTGAEGTCISAEQYCTPSKYDDPIETKDFGGYIFYNRKAIIKIIDDKGIQRSKKTIVRCVSDWENTKFNKFSRTVLLGRDILSMFKAKIILDSSKKITKFNHIIR